MSGLEQNPEVAENRTDADRRTVTWRTVRSGFLRSRRRATRRTNEEEPLFTDWHHPWLFFLATGIMLLSTMDAFFTLQLLDRGATEINPIMAAVIGNSALTFASTKMVLTGVCVLALVFLSRSKFLNIMRTSLVLTIFFSFYAVLVCYEFVMLIRQL